MKVSDREALVQKKNVRLLYGGKYEPLFHGSIFLALTWFYVNLDIPSGKFIAHIPIISLLALHLWGCISYFVVARIFCIVQGNEVSIRHIKDYMQCNGYTLKNSGKYFVEAYLNNNNLLIADTHVTVFEYEGMLYASAFKYGSWGWHYVPFYFGHDKVNEIQANVSF